MWHQYSGLWLCSINTQRRYFPSLFMCRNVWNGRMAAEVFQREQQADWHPSNESHFSNVATKIECCYSFAPHDKFRYDTRIWESVASPISVPLNSMRLLLHTKIATLVRNVFPTISHAELALSIFTCSTLSVSCGCVSVCAFRIAFCLTLFILL